jgi:glucose/arabinose dehydrogenase
VHRRTMLKTGLVAPVALAPLLLGAPAEADIVNDGALARGLTFPWGCDFLPDGSALVTERNSGRILHVSPSGGHTVVGTVPGTYNDGGEGGLLGLALSPTFATDRWVYCYQTTRTDNRVIRMRYSGGSLGAPEVVYGGIARSHNHNGGGLWFSDYPSLFVTVGDNRHPARGQDLHTPSGKILRMKPDGSPQTGNPFGNRIYSYGHRNVEGITIDDRGRVWASELGENTWDELNHIQAGHNYGWAKVEGRDGRGGYSDPFVEWHTDDCSPSGIAVTRGRAWIGGLRGQCLWAVDIEGPRLRRKTRYFHTSFGRIRMVKLAPDGSLWIGTSNGGGKDKVIRLRFT